MNNLTDDNHFVLMISNLKDFDVNDYSVTWPFIAGLFSLVAIVLSIFEIYKHLLNYTKPSLQKYIVRILWMVPIYALNSWLAMFFPKISIYMDTLRECYEAFVIYSFLKYLFNFLYKEVDSFEIIVDCKPDVHHLFPFCYLPPLRGGRRFISSVRHGMIQYIIIRPITTFLALIMQIGGIYGEGEISFRYGYLYLLIINNISQTIAMYYLVIFYHNFKRELAPMKPLGKFLCIKAVIFFSFFQSVLLTFLIHIGIITRAFIPNSADASSYEMSKNLQDFLICFEMLLAAIAHTYVFAHKSFIDESQGTNSTLYSMTRFLDMTDERSDIADHFRHLGLRFKEVVMSSNRSDYQSIDEDISRPLIPLQVRKNYGSNFL